MAYQINLTGQEIDERLQNVGTAEDKAAADGTLYARIKKNADDIAENKENVKVLTKRVDVVTGTANGAEALAKANEKRLNTVTGTANTAKELAQKNQFNLGQVQATANTALKNSEVNQDSVRNAQITANEAKALVSNLKNVTDEIESNVTHLQELNVVYSNSIRNLTTESTSAEIFHAFVPKIGGSVDVINTPHVGYLIKGNKNGDDQDDPDSTIISVEIVKIDDKDCHKFMYIDNNRDLVTMTVYLNKVNIITGHKLIERSVVSNIDTVMTTLTEHDARQTNIEKVVSGARSEAYFSLRLLNLIVSSKLLADIDNIKVVLYRWSGKSYSELEMFTKNSEGVSQKRIQYVIILKQEDKDGANIRTPYIHYNDDATEERLWEALKDEFGGRISYRNHKKRRWRIQAFLNNKPITAPFDLKVAIDCNDNLSLTKGGMMRSVPASRQVKYDGYYDVNKWINCKVGEELDLNYRFFNEDLDLISQKFPNPGDVMVENASSHTVPRGVIISVFQDTPGSYCILWSDGESIYEIGIDLDTNEYGGYNCYSPAKKLCDNIYGYVSKMSSGTLRDLYISAGAKYNEATGYYELNGLTDITEEEMRIIWQEDLSGWYINGRTNLTRNISVKGNTGGYNGGIDIACICINNKNLQVFNLGADCFARYMDSAFKECSNLETIDTRFKVVPYDTNLGINTFRGCIKLKDVRFNNHYLRMKATLNLHDSPLISKESVLSAITTTDNASATSAGFLTITLHADAYARLKDDADIIAALEAKNGVVTLVSA